MFTVTGSMPAPGLTHDELWEALLQKAEYAVPFVPAITECRVVERGLGYFVREIVLRGERLRERVTLHGKECVRFERLGGSAMGVIENRIEGDEMLDLSLRFTFRLAVDGLAHGSPAERAFRLRMRDSYLTAVRTTVHRAQELSVTGCLVA